MGEKLDRATDDTKVSGLMVIVGAVLMIQGFGNVLTRAVWSSDWGLLAVADRHASLPEWTGAVLGVIGLGVLVGGLVAVLKRG